MVCGFKKIIHVLESEQQQLMYLHGQDQDSPEAGLLFREACRLLAPYLRNAVMNSGSIEDRVMPPSPIEVPPMKIWSFNAFIQNLVPKVVVGAEPEEDGQAEQGSKQKPRQSTGSAASVAKKPRVKVSGKPTIGKSDEDGSDAASGAASEDEDGGSQDEDDGSEGAESEEDEDMAAMRALRDSGNKGKKRKAGAKGSKDSKDGAEKSAKKKAKTESGKKKK